MSREVRRVPMDWEHPHVWADQWDSRLGLVVGTNVFRPLFDRNYADMLADFEADPDNWDGRKPDPADYMPDFANTHPDVDPDEYGWCMYETTSKGTPISPVLSGPEELAHWLADHNASAFGGTPAGYSDWLATIRQGWAPSAVSFGRGPLVSGVEGFAAAAAAARHAAEERARALADIADALGVER